MRKVGEELFPGCADFDRAEFWAGLRPMTPTSVPILGRARYENLYLDCGHGPCRMDHGLRLRPFRRRPDCRPQARDRHRRIVTALTCRFREFTIDLERIERNARTVVERCRAAGIGVFGVTKGTCGMPQVARAMLRGGVTGIGGLRLRDIRRLRASGDDAPIMLLRSPPLSLIEESRPWRGRP